ncbi:MAG: SPOR domain-containing protein [Bacteroidota bacterium]
MAKDDQNKDKEEDDDFFGDDDDFGLPELDYEALDDDDDDLSDSDFEVSDEELAAEMEAEDQSAELDAADDSDVSFESDESMAIDDIELPDDLEEEELSDDDLGDFYEEESFEDFNASDDGSGGTLDTEVTSNDLLEDDFKEDDFVDTSTPNAYVEQDQPGGSGNKFVKLVVIGIVVFVSLGLGILYLSGTFSGEDKKVAEKTEQAEAEKKAAAARAEKQRQAAEAKRRLEEQKKAQEEAAAAAANEPQATAGEINALEGATGNFHIIIASFLDEDMAADYAGELAGAGNSPTIVPPFGKAITTRVAIKSFSSLANAQQEIGDFKGEYGNDIWVLKY